MIFDLTVQPQLCKTHAACFSILWVVLDYRPYSQSTIRGIEPAAAFQKQRQSYPVRIKFWFAQVVQGDSLHPGLSHDDIRWLEWQFIRETV